MRTKLVNKGQADGLNCLLQCCLFTLNQFLRDPNTSQKNQHEPYPPNLQFTIGRLITCFFIFTVMCRTVLYCTVL